MKLKLETESASVKLTTKDDKVDFKALVKVYELATGAELKLNGIKLSHPEPKPSKPAIDRGGVKTITDDLTPDSTPGWHEPVKTKLMCPYCGNNEVTTVWYGNKFMKCPKCGEKVRLEGAASRWGVPDQHGFYYKAQEVWRDYQTEQADSKLLEAMKQKMEENNAK